MNETPSRALPSVPRTAWEDHPKYPSQVLLLGSHRSFRRLSRTLAEAAAAGSDPGVIGLHYGMWMAGMRSHEAYEERKLYPYLEAHYPVRFDELRDGHEELHRIEAEVRSALAGDGDLAGAFRRYDRALNDHLDLEEEAVIPLLLEMETDEFARFLESPIEVLLRRAASAEA